MKPVARRYSRETSSERRHLMLATLVVILVLLVDIATGGRVRSLIRGIAARAWDGTHAITSGIQSIGLFATHTQLAAANASLREQLAQYQGQEANAAALQQQNEDLQRMVHLVATHPGITAPVVGMPDAAPYGTFLVGAGRGDGVAAGALVRTDDGFAIGRVSDVQAHEATVVELLAPDAQIEVGDGTTSFTLRGIGGGNARAEVPRDAVIHPGDVLIAPSAGGAPVAVVGHIDADPAGGAQQVYARIPQGMTATRYVLIENL